MSVVTFSFYRLVQVTAPTGEVTTEREEFRSPIRYDSINPAPGTEIRLHGFPPCTCPQAPACHAREAARPPARSSASTDPEDTATSFPRRVPGRNLAAEPSRGRAKVPPPPPPTPSPVPGAGGVPTAESASGAASGRHEAALAASSP
jgi:hypothetical protein